MMKIPTCVVPCGKQQKTASTSEKSASLIATKFGRSCNIKRGSTYGNTNAYTEMCYCWKVQLILDAQEWRIKCGGSEEKFLLVLSSEEIQIQTVHRLSYLRSSLWCGTEGGLLEAEQSVGKNVHCHISNWAEKGAKYRNTRSGMLHRKSKIR